MARLTVQPLPDPGRDHCLAPARRGHGDGSHAGYGRMFPELEPLRAGEEFFAAHGRAAVAGDDATFVDRDPDGPERPDLPAAGWPVFGQWVAHELTADRSRLASRADVGELVNARTPRLNLESLYGLGPADQPYLVRRDDPARLLVGGTAERPDLPRNARASP